MKLIFQTLVHKVQYPTNYQLHSLISKPKATRNNFLNPRMNFIQMSSKVINNHKFHNYRN